MATPSRGIGRGVHMRGRKHSVETRKKMGLAHLGDKNVMRRPEVVAKFMGANSHFWKGGVTTLSQRVRASAKYREWRKAVFEFYGYRCFSCGETGYLQADHILPFAYFPRLRFDINNGQALCVPCHKQTPTYAQKAKNLYE